MRFASFSLERYGRFEDCELIFRSGAPDLHVVYGANEAGKTTSLAAVSDLLFGFPARSPYNFRFDYALLRVGAVLEYEERSFACRRKKGTSATLIDGEDRPLDEGVLLAMLRGQTRETFGLSFSLNQDGLRAGGRAMVEARNDLGRALFAAGSGLTGISDELGRLESEADAIWGQRAAARRSFTQAQRDLEAQIRAMREQTLKPKAWLEARSAVEAAQETLAQAQQHRDQILAEVSRVERVRRIAAAVRLREDHLAALTVHADTIDIGVQREEAALAALAEIDAAVRASAVAGKLADEAQVQIEARSPDPSCLALGDQIDDIVTAAGAVEKGRRDMARLSGARAAAQGHIERLREEAGTIGSAAPSRIVSAKLREMARGHAEDVAALGQIAQSELDLADRRETIAQRASHQRPLRDVAALASAIDLAKTLGSDADDRCEQAQRKAENAAAAAGQALARLAPWQGDGDALAVLPHLGEDEIDEARSGLSEIEADILREQEAAARAREEAEALALELEQLSSGPAVSSDDIQAARHERQALWLPLRAHVLEAAALPSPRQTVAAYEAAVGEADDRDDARFTAADESSRLIDIGQRRTRLLLAADQASARAEAATARRDKMLADWAGKLSDAGYPDLAPGRLSAWLSARNDAQAAGREAATAADAARTLVRRRDQARAGLAAALAGEAGLPEGQELGPLVTLAEQIRQAAEADAQQQRLDESALVQIDHDAQNLARRRKRVEEIVTDRQKDWDAVVAELGLALRIDSAATTLDVLDELRAALGAHGELQTRIDGMARDAREHEDRVNVLADALGIAASQDLSLRLDEMRKRLADARATANLLSVLEDGLAARKGEMAAEEARREAAWLSLTSLLDETNTSDTEGLRAAIDRSREVRALRAAVSETEAAIVAAGDGIALEDLIASVTAVDPDGLAGRAQTLAGQLAELNEEVAAAASRHGDARRAFTSLEEEGHSSAAAASDAEQARSELAVLAEDYILKRAQAVTLRWAIEQYREQHQDPLLLRASVLFRELTIGKYQALRIDTDGSSPRLLGLRDDGRTVVDVGAMSEGTTDQLFLALRLAAIEQAVAAGVRLPFLADDLFVNFDDERSEAGFRVLAELARSTQVLFFTHHPHLAAIARSVVGEDLHSECKL